MAKTVAFLAQTPGSATIAEQKACLGPNDIPVLAGRSSFNKLSEILARNNMALKPGDHVRVHSLSCLALATTMLIRALTKLLESGISIQIMEPAMVIHPRGEEQKHALLSALDAHYRHVHGVKTHPVGTAPQGRKRVLEPDQLPAIRALLDKPGSTATEVAQELGVARSTLFNYLARYGGERTLGGQKTKQRRAKNARNDLHLLHGDSDLSPTQDILDPSDGKPTAQR